VTDERLKRRCMLWVEMMEAKDAFQFACECAGPSCRMSIRLLDKYEESMEAWRWAVLEEDGSSGEEG
jgi:hypothetical protein